jgi:hypothetical protein
MSRLRIFGPPRLAQYRQLENLRVTISHKLVKFGVREHYLKLQNYYELSKNARKMVFFVFRNITS